MRKMNSFPYIIAKTLLRNNYDKFSSARGTRSDGRKRRAPSKNNDFFGKFCKLFLSISKQNFFVDERESWRKLKVIFY